MDSHFSYLELPWGDLIHGTKDQLREIGIGIDRAFPGDVGGPKRRMTAVDPRGFKCLVELDRFCDPAVFSVRIPFPNREGPSCCENWKPFAQGVQCREYLWTDEYKGTECALVASGLVPSGWFPGHPGMRKYRVIILPDGSLPDVAPTASCTIPRQPGDKRIEKIAGGEFLVSIKLSDDIGNTRLATHQLARDAWELKMATLPRPPRIDGPLRAVRNQAAADRRAGLHLVWSKPKFVPAFNLPPRGPFAR